MVLHRLLRTSLGSPRRICSSSWIYQAPYKGGSVFMRDTTAPHTTVNCLSLVYDLQIGQLIPSENNANFWVRSDVTARTFFLVKYFWIGEMKWLICLFFFLYIFYYTVLLWRIIIGNSLDSWEENKTCSYVHFPKHQGFSWRLHIPAVTRAAWWPNKPAQSCWWPPGSAIVLCCSCCLGKTEGKNGEPFHGTCLLPSFQVVAVKEELRAYVL